MKKLIVTALLCLLSGFSQIAQAQTPHNIAFAGDSIVNGHHATTAANSLTGRLLCSRPYWWINNVSADGASVTGVSAVTANAALPVDVLPDTIVVFLGNDDWAFNAVESSFKTAYTNYLQVCEFLSPTIICVTPIWDHREGTNNTQGYTLATLRSDIATICTGRGHAVIDGLTLVPNDPAFYIFDGTHPNDNGYASFAANLSSALGALIP